MTVTINRHQPWCHTQVSFHLMQKPPEMIDAEEVYILFYQQLGRKERVVVTC